MRLSSGVCIVAIGVAVLAGCADSGAPTSLDGEPTGETPSPTPTSTSTPSPAPTTEPAMPCDPRGGFPQGQSGCSELSLETGWLEVSASGRRVLRPFRTLLNDAAGRAYAESHGMAYPFATEYVDAPDGSPHEVAGDESAVCTGIIRVGYRDPLQDHVVPCAALLKEARRDPLPVALWSDDDGVVQVSELYRP